MSSIVSYTVNSCESDHGCIYKNPIEIRDSKSLHKHHLPMQVESGLTRFWMLCTKHEAIQIG